MITLMLGIFEFGRAYWVWTTIQYAAEETGRYAMSRPSSTAAELVNYLKTRAPGLAPTTLVIQVVPETVSGVPYMHIRARYPFSFIGLVPVGLLNLEGRSRVPVVT
jgi:hypothetical protein